MLLKRGTLTHIENGTVSLAFRRWRRPTVKSGGTLLTAIGQLAIESVEVVDIDSITATEATQAGFDDLAALRAELARRPNGDVYRVQLHLAGPDPRIALRETAPDEGELHTVRTRLQRFDGRSSSGPWTLRTLQLIADFPATRAGDLAPQISMELASFKANIRKLKKLGLTESLKIGYRLSPRGEAVLASMD